MFRTTALPLALLGGLSCTLVGQDNKKAEKAAQALRAKYQQAALAGGNSARGKQVFTSEKAGCVKCHLIEGDGQRAGPDLRVVGDKYALDQLIRSVLEPSAAIHPDYATLVVATVAGKVHTGVLRKRTNQEIQLLDAESKLVRYATRRPSASLGKAPHEYNLSFYADHARESGCARTRRTGPS